MAPPTIRSQAYWREYKRVKQRAYRDARRADPERWEAERQRWRAQNKKRWAKKTPEQKAAEYAKTIAYQKANPERNKEYRRRATKNRRLAVLSAYGGKCACCGDATYEFLTVDHINGGGGKHRREIKQSLYQWLKRNNFPPGFRILCANCHLAISFFGGCPHAKHD